jgi:methyl-accepting chemotaxis protein
LKEEAVMKKRRLTLRVKLVGTVSVLMLCSILALGISSYISSEGALESVVSTDLGPVVRLATNIVATSQQAGRDLSTVEKDILPVKLGVTGYVFVMDDQGVLRLHPVKKGQSLLAHQFAKDILQKSASLGAGQVGEVRYAWRNAEAGETKDREKIAIFARDPGSGLIVVASSYIEEFTGEAQSAILLNIIIVTLVSLVAGGIFVSIFAARFIKPILAVRDVARKVAEGDLTSSVSSSANDEVGDLAEAFNTMVSDLHSTIEQVQTAAASVAGASSQISSSTEELAAGSEEQTTQAGEVASAVEEMTKTIIENSRNASETAETAKTMRRVANDGGSVVTETVEGMKRIADVTRRSASTVQTLGKSSAQIGEIIGVIDDIADQTNLLALNAAIEAARAGDQGRGFAVVADEVRKLAERTTKATKEIASMIKQIQHDTVDAVKSMDQGTQEVDSGIAMADRAGASLKEIVEVSQKVTDMVAQIAAASEEQSSASEQISKNVEAISTVTSETANGTQQIAHAAEDLNRLTEQLHQLIGRFQLRGGESHQGSSRAAGHERQSRAAAGDGRKSGATSKWRTTAHEIEATQAG